MKFEDFFRNESLKKEADSFMICPMGGSAPMKRETRVNLFRKHYSPVNLYPPNYKIIPYCNGPCVFMSQNGMYIPNSKLLIYYILRSLVISVSRPSSRIFSEYDVGGSSQKLAWVACQPS